MNFESIELQINTKFEQANAKFEQTNVKFDQTNTKFDQTNAEVIKMSELSESSFTLSNEKLLFCYLKLT